MLREIMIINSDIFVLVCNSIALALVAAAASMMSFMLKMKL